MEDKDFISLVKKNEKRSANISAWAIFYAGRYAGRVIASHLKGGGCEVIGWIGPKWTRVGGKNSGGGVGEILRGSVIELNLSTITLSDNWIDDLSNNGFIVANIL